MTKEYYDYKFFSLLYIVIVANVGLLFTQGLFYNLIFASSIGIMAIYALIERRKLGSISKGLKDVTFNRNLVYLIFIIWGYIYHYRPLNEKANYLIVFALQFVSVILFVFVYCIGEKSPAGIGASSPERLSDNSLK